MTDDRTHYVGDGCASHPVHHGPCSRALDGDGEPLGYCADCYRDMPGAPVVGSYDSDTDQLPGHHTQLMSDRNGAWTSCCCGWASSIGLFKDAVVALHAHLAAVADPTPCPECAVGKCGNCDGRTWDRDADSYIDCPCAGAGHG